MKLSQCSTVRDSLHWMDKIVPGFWDFATKRPLPRKSVREITSKLDLQWSGFIQMYQHINRLKKHSTWSVEDGCYSSLLDNAFSPIIAHEDLSKWMNKTKSC